MANSPETSYTKAEVAKKFGLTEAVLPAFDSITLSDKDATDIDGAPDKLAVIKAIVQRESAAGRITLAAAVSTGTAKARTAEEQANGSVEDVTTERSSPEPKEHTLVEQIVDGDKSGKRLKEVLDLINSKEFVNVSAKGVYINAILEHFIYDNDGRSLDLQKCWFDSDIVIAQRDGTVDKEMSDILEAGLFNSQITKKEVQDALALNRVLSHIVGTPETVRSLAEKVARSHDLIAKDQNFDEVVKSGRLATLLNEKEKSMPAEDLIILRSYITNPQLVEEVAVLHGDQEALSEKLGASPYNFSAEEIAKLLTASLEEIAKDEKLKTVLLDPVIVAALTKARTNPTATATAAPTDTGASKPGSLPPKPSIEDVIRNPEKIFQLIPHMGPFAIFGAIWLFMKAFNLGGEKSFFRTLMGALGGVGVMKAFGLTGYAADMYKNMGAEDFTKAMDWAKNMAGRLKGAPSEIWQKVAMMWEFREFTGMDTDTSGAPVRRSVMDMGAIALKNNLAAGNDAGIQRNDNGTPKGLEGTQRDWLVSKLNSLYLEAKTKMQGAGKQLTDAELDAHLKDLSVLELIDWVTDPVPQGYDWTKPALSETNRPAVASAPAPAVGPAAGTQTGPAGANGGAPSTSQATGSVPAAAPVVPPAAAPTGMTSTIAIP